jgi:hypothetical protein
VPSQAIYSKAFQRNEVAEINTETTPTRPHSDSLAPVL